MGLSCNKYERVSILLFKHRKKEKPDEIFILDGCQVRVYIAPKVRRALRTYLENQQEGKRHA
jgi:hypothetical protein